MIMKSIYTFCTNLNNEGKHTIVFNQRFTYEFIKIILQVLGMYNYILVPDQNIWQHERICVKLIAPNGVVFLKVDEEKKITLAGIDNQMDILKIRYFLNQFVHFKEEEKLELAIAV